MTKTVKTIVLALAALGGCGGLAPRETQDPAAEQPQVAEVRSALGSTEASCMTGPAAATISGTGEVRSGTNYNPSGGCFRAYVVDVNNYSAGGLGSLVSYGSAAPTNADECTRTSLRVYVWRRDANGTATFIDNVIRRGTWVADGFGGNHCAVPNVDVKRTFPTITRGGNYRFGLRASVLPPTGSTVAEVFKQIYVEVTPPLGQLKAADYIARLGQYAATLPASGGAIDPGVTRVWAGRSFPAGVKGLMCRTMKLQLTLMRQNDFSLKRLIQSDQGAAVDRRTTSAEQIRALICDPLPAGVTEAAALASLQTALKTHAGAIANVQQLAMRFMNVTASDAGEIIGQSMMLDLRRLGRACGDNATEILNFLQVGTIPAGMPGADVLTRNCTGSTTSIAAGAGIGADTGGNRQTRFRACVDAQAAQFTEQCTGPRVESDPTNAGTTTAPDGRQECAPGQTLDLDANTCVDNPAGQALTPEQVQAWLQATQQARESEERSKDLTVVALSGALGGAIFAVLPIVAEASSFPGVVIAGMTLSGVAVASIPAIVAGLVVAGASIGIFVASRNADEARERACAIDRTSCPKNQRCAEYDLLGNRAWFQSEGSPFHPDGHETGKADQIDDCICQLFDRDYGKLPADFLFGGPSGWCPTSKERQAEECLRNPEKPAPVDGAPGLRPECVALMQPKEVDRNSLATRWCKYKMPNCDGAFLQDDGNCGCPEATPGAAGAGTKPACQNINVLDCLPDGMLDEKTCLCVPANAGLGCPAGGLSGYLAKTPSDVFLATFPRETALRGKNLLMFAPGNTPVTTRKMIDTRLTNLQSLNVFTRIPTPTVSSGLQGWAVQVLCTNEGNNVQNRSLGTAQLQTRTPGAATLNFPLTAADRTACFNSTRTPVRFEIRSNNQAGQPRLAFEDLSVTNLIDDLPGIPDPCRTPPKPLPPPGDPLPIQPLPFDTLFRQLTWRFSDGVLVANPVIR